MPIPLPWIGSFSLGLAGGPLVMALILGRLGRVGKISWRLPLSANLVMRNYGLTIFLASVGMASGLPFVQQVGAERLAPGCGRRSGADVRGRRPGSRVLW